jgi:D-glycerate 3-kinase
MTLVEQGFLQRNQLPGSYLAMARQWFKPLLTEFSENYRASQAVQIIGINGSQGSGKSTLGDYFCSMVEERHDVAAVCLSMDDFYLTRSQRIKLAKDIHPLLVNRGLPGTHDIKLAISTINSLISGQDETLITRFDKSTDDRCDISAYDKVSGPVGLIILEGWCFGARPAPEESLDTAINLFEKQTDPDGICRRHVNKALSGDYQELFAIVDRMVMLLAPSFDVVFQWRLEQEQKMIAQLKKAKPGVSGSRVMSEQQIFEYIQNFQRITEHCLVEMPSRVDHLFVLDQHRNISAYSQPTR